eukprot:6425393-Prymnesium_polylepis.1
MEPARRTIPRRRASPPPSRPAQPATRARILNGRLNCLERSYPLLELHRACLVEVLGRRGAAVKGQPHRHHRNHKQRKVGCHTFSFHF